MIKTTQNCLFCKKPTVFNINTSAQQISLLSESCITCKIVYYTQNDKILSLIFNMDKYQIVLWSTTKTCTVNIINKNGTWVQINHFDFMPELTPDTTSKFLKRVIKLLPIS